MTISGWNRDRLAEVGLDARRWCRPASTSRRSARCPDVARRDDMLLALGRTNPLKNLPLTIDAWRGARRRRAARARACSASSPSSGPQHGATLRRAAERRGRQRAASTRPPCSCRPRRTRASACRRWRRWRPAARSSAPTRTATATSASTASNCLIPEPTVESVSGAIGRLLGDPALRERLGAAGIETAADYAWERRIDELEAFLERRHISSAMCGAERLKIQ